MYELALHLALTRLDTTDALDRFRTRAMQSSLGDAIMTENWERVVGALIRFRVIYVARGKGAGKCPTSQANSERRGIPTPKQSTFISVKAPQILLIP